MGVNVKRTHLSKKLDHERKYSENGNNKFVPTLQDTSETTQKISSEPKEMTLGIGVLLACALCVGILNGLHTSSLFENDRNFSHLSDLEREMAFRTETGFYYYHYKTLVEADSFVTGLTHLIHNNITEYPNIINSLQRFNVMPEVVIAGLYRSLLSFSHWAQLQLKTCYKVSRGASLSWVLSCDGLGVPVQWYLLCTWCMAGLTAALVFIAGAQLSKSLLGGVLAALCFFFNHGEATRVMWAPPLRETFSFPFALLVNIVVTSVLRRPALHYRQVLYMAVAAYAYLVSWQFSQFTLMITVLVVYFLYTMQVIRPLPMLLVLMGCIVGFACCLMSMFTNKMLLTSPLAGCLIAIFLMYVTLENIINWVPAPLNTTLQVATMALSTAAFTLELSNLFGTEDSHVYKILLSKFTNYSDFDTALYTCAGEFGFLPVETVYKLSITLLLPVVLVVISAVYFNMLKMFVTNLHQNSMKTDKLSVLWKGFDAGILYNILMLFSYCFMSALIMRLKLFMTPQLCITASLITCPSLFKVANKRGMFYGFIAALVAVMSVTGCQNVWQQRSVKGEYLNTELEELLEWVSAETSSTAVFAGTMPTMANLMLSTGRPIVNHPHYEAAAARLRTKQVYSVFSRNTPQSVYETLVNLKVNYLVLDAAWCFHRNKPGCGIVDLWDAEQPEKKNRPALCPKLYKNSPTPFHRVFSNYGYVVLQVPSRYVQIPPPKTFQS